MNFADVTVITPTVPHRYEMLFDCIESVRNQTVLPKNHFIGVDYEREGIPKTINKMISNADTEWIAPLCDDDVYYSNYIERLIQESNDADMIYPWCNVVNHPTGWNPNSYFDPQRLLVENYIPATVLIRKSVWEELGGYPDCIYEDWMMWIKLVQRKKRIKCVPEVLWEYRFHGRNISSGVSPLDI